MQFETFCLELPFWIFNMTGNCYGIWDWFDRWKHITTGHYGSTVLLLLEFNVEPLFFFQTPKPGENSNLSNVAHVLYLWKRNNRGIIFNLRCWILASSVQTGNFNWNWTKISASADGVLAPGSVHARPSAQPPIDTSGNFPAHMSAESPSNISPNPSEP